MRAYTDKSVRDFPVRVTVRQTAGYDEAVLKTRCGGVVMTTIAVGRREWRFPPGFTPGNADYDRRQMIRQKLMDIGVAFDNDGGETMERVADAHMNALKKVWPQ